MYPILQLQSNLTISRAPVLPCSPDPRASIKIPQPCHLSTCRTVMAVVDKSFWFSSSRPLSYHGLTMWGVQGAFLIIARPCLRKQHPNIKLTISGIPYHLSTPPFASTLDFRMSSTSPFLPMPVVTNIIAALWLIPELAGMVIRYHALYAA